MFYSFFHTSTLFHTICLQFRWLGEWFGAPGVRFNAFRMHQFKCFTSNINSLSVPLNVSTGDWCEINCKILCALLISS